MRTLMLVHHRVADFSTWKQVYDGYRDAQRQGGVRFHQVLRSREDPGMVVVTHVFDSRAEAEAFVNDPDLQATMGRAGVDASTVVIEYLDEVDYGDI